MGQYLKEHPVGHWWAQRLTAAAMIPMIIWALWGLCHTKGEYLALSSWLKNPLVTLVMVTLGTFILYHAQLGIKVVIEDYIATLWARKFCFFLNNSGMIIGIGLIIFFFCKLHASSMV